MITAAYYAITTTSVYYSIKGYGTLRTYPRLCFKRLLSECGTSRCRFAACWIRHPLHWWTCLECLCGTVCVCSLAASSRTQKKKKKKDDRSLMYPTPGFEPSTLSSFEYFRDKLWYPRCNNKSIFTAVIKPIGTQFSIQFICVNTNYNDYINLHLLYPPRPPQSRCVA